MNTTQPIPKQDTAARLVRLVARLRSRQLDHALRGRVLESARFAQRVQRVRRAATAAALERL